MQHRSLRTALAGVLRALPSGAVVRRLARRRRG